MKYANWKLRREVMANPHMSAEVKLYALVIIDHVDWTTGVKKFHAKTHYDNWLKGIAESYGFKSFDLGLAVTELVNTGTATLDKSQGLLTLHNGDEWDTGEEGENDVR